MKKADAMQDCPMVFPTCMTIRLLRQTAILNTQRTLFSSKILTPYMQFLFCNRFFKIVFRVNRNWFSGIIILFISTAAFSVSAQPVQCTMLRIPDTGQTTDYTSTPGEDSDYMINVPYFTNNGDGTVTDTNTTLMWQEADGGEMTIEDAQIYVDTLALGGYTNWRLPTAQEAFSILNHDQVNPAIDLTVFAQTTADYWWTSERQKNDSSKVWVTNAGGGIGNHPKSETISAGGNKRFHVRAVRDDRPPFSFQSQFYDPGTGVITDSLTGLMWMKSAYIDSLSWEDALNFSDTLSLAGYSDWRLPNVKELESLNDETKKGPSLNPVFHSANMNSSYWSSTSLPNQPLKAWYMETDFGVVTYANKTARHEVRCVRSGGVILDVESVVSKSNSDVIFFHESFPLNADVEFALFDLSGQLICSGRNSSDILFPLLSPGTYFLREKSGNVKRLIKY